MLFEELTLVHKDTVYFLFFVFFDKKLEYV